MYHDTGKGKVKRMLTYVFPGQGSQMVGMGKDLFDEFPDLVAIADEILGYSIKELCLEDKNGNINNTQYSQPALYMVNAMMYYKRLKEDGVIPDYVAGHSLGEYNALLAAEVFDFATGLKLVKKRGELMGKAKNGAMAAVIGLTEEKIAKIIHDEKLDQIDIANFNSPAQTVISSTTDEIERAAAIFEKNGARYVPLKVSAAFHSRYMNSAMEEYKQFMQNIDLKAPKIKVISNVTARPYKKNEIRETLVPQITSSVRWCETIRFLMGRCEEMQFVQIGPGNVLNGLIRNIKKDATPIYDVEDPEDVEEAEESKASVEVEESMASKESVAATMASSLKPSIPVENSTEEEKAKTTEPCLGNPDIMKRYNIQSTCFVGPMQMGISSAEMVEKLAKDNMLSFLGTTGVELKKIERELESLKRNCGQSVSYGVSVVHTPRDPQREMDLVNLLLKQEVHIIEVSAYIKITEPLVLYRLSGLSQDRDGRIESKNRIIVKASRPEVVRAFLTPAPKKVVLKLLESGLISAEQARLAETIPMADDICALADAGASTDMGTAYVVLPSMKRLRDEMVAQYGYQETIHVGQAGGIGTPEAVAAAFMLGADFIETGSINQCTIEADTSDAVKDLLEAMDIQDTEYVPSEIFEFGGKVQVLKKGSLFFARLNKLYEIYRQYNSIDELDSKLKDLIQNRYFKKSFQEVFDEVKRKSTSAELERLQTDEKYKMAMIFGWYSSYGFQLALEGDQNQSVDYHVNCGPAMGAFNRYVKGTQYEHWRNRSVVEINQRMMRDAMVLVKQQLEQLFQ